MTDTTHHQESDDAFLDKILGQLAEELINYDKRMTDAGAPNVRFVHKYNSKAAKALKAWKEARNTQARIDLLKKCYVDQGEIYVKFDTGFCEQYEYIKQLKAATTTTGEGESE